MFCLHFLCKILSNLCFVLFTSPLQNIKPPLFCFVYIFLTKYYATFVLFCLHLLYKILSNLCFVLICLHLLYKILSNLCFVLFTSPLQNIKQPLSCFVYIFLTKYYATFVLFCLHLLYKILSNVNNTKQWLLNIL